MDCTMKTNTNLLTQGKNSLLFEIHSLQSAHAWVPRTNPWVPKVQNMRINGLWEQGPLSHKLLH